MEEDNALRNYCRRMVSVIRSKQPHLKSSKWERKRHNNQRDSGRENTEGGRRVLVGDESRDREGEQPSLRLPPGQGPEAPAVPARLISMLKLKTFEENMRRAAEAGLHHPTGCKLCEHEQASLALKTFIWRKKTQLRFQTLKGRLNRTMETEISLPVAGVHTSGGL